MLILDVSSQATPCSLPGLTLETVTRSIVGLKKEESEALLAFLFNHIGRGIDFQARVRWQPKTVVVWDVSISF